jgi:hypothetical protein
MKLVKMFKSLVGNPPNSEPTESKSWEEAYSLLARSEECSGSEAICKAITRLGKPYDRQQVHRAAPLVLRYLAHDDFLVRYQAIWFLGSWGRLCEYLPSIIQSARSDANVDNRSFAARCAGVVLESHRDAEATKALLSMATAEDEEPDVRKAAYGALLCAFNGKAGWNRAREFDPIGDKSVTDFDLAWLASLPKWIGVLPTKTS